MIRKLLLLTVAASIFCPHTHALSWKTIKRPLYVVTGVGMVAGALYWLGKKTDANVCGDARTCLRKARREYDTDITRYEHTIDINHDEQQLESVANKIWLEWDTIQEDYVSLSSVIEDLQQAHKELVIRMRSKRTKKNKARRTSLTSLIKTAQDVDEFMDRFNAVHKYFKRHKNYFDAYVWYQERKILYAQECKVLKADNAQANIAKHVLREYKDSAYPRVEYIDALTSDIRIGHHFAKNKYAHLCQKIQALCHHLSLIKDLIVHDEMYRQEKRAYKQEQKLIAMQEKLEEQRRQLQDLQNQTVIVYT